LSPEALTAIAAGMSAVSAIAALMIGWITLRESRIAAETRRRHSAHFFHAALQSRLDPMYPGLRQVLGHLEDGVPHEIRQVLIPFFVLYGNAYAAHRDGLLDDRDWNGFERELAYWAQKPTARRAWTAFSQQTWTHGFADHMQQVHSGSAAYPNLIENSAQSPEVVWPDEPSSH
jgi:hypothetical protein